MRKINKNQLNDWENPEIFEKNQVLPHTTLIPFSNQKQALNFDKTLSSFYFSLNGNWKFNWSPNIEEAPVDFYKKDYSYEDWEEIKVPSNWQMQGYGYPLFRNVGHSFPSDPPRVPADFNPVGSYIKTFSLPQNWDDKKIFLHFEGVKSASYVWINGKKVGYNQGGMEPAEYDITQYLKPGENKIAVQVLRYSDGTYLECQDMWRLSGIYRDIYLMATPEVHLRDFYVTTDLDLDYKDAELKVKTRIKNYKKNKVNNYKLIIELFNRDGKEVLSRPLEKNPGTLKAEREKEVVITETIKNPEKWSAESPYLYTICLKLQDETGEIVEILSHKVGFRKVEIKNQAIYVNGAPVKLNGVNSHMQHPETGRMLDKETMKKDLTLMKKFNINCVRTSHYPPNKEYLNLADKLGIYIIDEVGDEAHANEYLSDDPVWKEQYLDRMRKMVYRDRNHPSVIVWSAGNESGLGENICAIIEEGKKIDPSRPGWMYGGNKDNIPADNPIKCEDIVGPRYSRPFSLENHFGQIKKSEDSRPSFMDEYLSAAGNSLGGLDEYWDLIRKYHRLTGGAIWDWISPGLKKKVILTEDKSPYHHLCSLMGRSYLEKVESGKVLSLSGHDEWLEVYRSSALDITENQLSISLWVYPETRNDSSLITKGNYQFGLEQKQNKLIFYLGGKSKIQIETELPIYWTDRWHHIAGIYDGEKISLYIDGELVVTQNWNQQLKNTPFPVTIGKNAQTQGQDYPGKLFSGLIDKVRLFDKVVTIENLYQDSNLSPEESLLWLDFETTEPRGNFYTLGIGARSYGLVWPDRRVKPELWQVKKSAQPVSLEMDNLEKKRIKIINRHHFKNLKEFTGIWEVSKNGINGETIQTGELDLDLAPGEEKIIQIPFSQPKNGSEDYYLLISFRLSRGELWAR
ncbi:MAG: glycoside hydrolase family 2 TIM barrel-domain containing protein, partial [Halanaerobiales bacterium]